MRHEYRKFLRIAVWYAAAGIVLALWLMLNLKGSR
jgi:hypothetical protein